jgi:hypothetical protein
MMAAMIAGTSVVLAALGTQLHWEPCAAGMQIDFTTQQVPEMSNFELMQGADHLEATHVLVQITKCPWCNHWSTVVLSRYFMNTCSAQLGLLNESAGRGKHLK